ncbi:MAG: alpha/beta hydrolase [Burkholderiaceae bacterium]
MRVLLVAAREPKAAAILFTGGDGGLLIADDGRIERGAGNFLVRSRDRFAQAGVTVAVLGAPADRRSPPYLSGWRESAEHATDAKAVLAWLRERTQLPVWLVGTSRGTQSVAAVALRLGSPPDGPDGLVLTSTVLREARGTAVPQTAVERLAVPVLVVHHRGDACVACPPDAAAPLVDALAAAPRKALMMFDGGFTRGDPCGAQAYHGFNGIETEVVGRIAEWMGRR